MINSHYLYRLIEWLRSRSLQEQLGLYLLGFVIIYIVWYLEVMHFILDKRHLFIDHKTSFENEINIVHNKLRLIATTIAQKNHINLKESAGLQSQKSFQTFENIITKITHGPDAQTIIDQILALKTYGVQFIHLKSEPVSVLEFPHTANELPHLSKYPLQLDVKGDYFSIINYLHLLENLPGYFHWDSLTYTTNDYPQGNVTIKFYIVDQ